MTKAAIAAALYARISTKEGKQFLENQLRELREYAKRLDWTIAAEYTDEAGGAAKDRPGLDALMNAAASKIFDVVLVVDLSRLTRKGPASAFQYLEQLRSFGVEFHSYREPHFRTAGPHGALLIAIAAWFAEQERNLIRDRIGAGIARARLKGVTFGRKRRLTDRAKLRGLAEQGMSIRDIAKLLKISRSTVHRRMGEYRNEPQAGATRGPDEKPKPQQKAESSTQLAAVHPRRMPRATAGD